MRSRVAAPPHDETSRAYPNLTTTPQPSNQCARSKHRASSLTCVADAAWFGRSAANRTTPPTRFQASMCGTPSVACLRAPTNNKKKHDSCHRWFSQRGGRKCGCGEKGCERTSALECWTCVKRFGQNVIWTASSKHACERLVAHHCIRISMRCWIGESNAARAIDNK